MTVGEIAEKIRLPKEALAAGYEIEMSEKEYEERKRLFYEDLDKFLREWKNQDEKIKYTWALHFYLKLAADVYDRYMNEGISEEVFDQTFFDITIWCRSCFRKRGVYGLEELAWLAQSVKMQLFRLGRLQFEPVVLKESLEGNGVRIAAGVSGLNIHIPEGEPLHYEKCIDSLRKAELFFDGRKEGKPHFYMCDSWLLSPALKELLPEESNILKFQSLFHIVKVHDAFPQAEQRIFGEILEDKSCYPENTLLQKKAKEYILAGKNPGIGIGVIENVNKHI